MLNQSDVDTDRVSAPEATLLKHAFVSQAKVTENWLMFCHLSLLPVGTSALCLKLLDIGVIYLYECVQ